MGLSKSFKKIAKAVVNPVGAGIEKLTGIDQGDQFKIGAGLGLGALAFGGGTPGATGAGPGGIPLASAENGFAHSNSAGGLARMFSGALPSLIGVGGSYFGAKEAANAQELANEANVRLAREQMGFSAGQAQREMDFQERMSGTSYQRGIEDMKAAGINPMLAYSQGGASSPSGASGSAAGADIKAVPAVLQGTMTSAMDMMRTAAQVRQSQAATTNINQDTVNKIGQHGKIDAETRESSARGVSVNLDNRERARRQRLEGMDAKGRMGRAWSNIIGLTDAILSRMPNWISKSSKGAN